MTYLNADRYLWLKQQLVLKRMADLGAAVKLKDRPVDGELYLKGILDVLEDIESEFTMPYALLENENVYLDLDDAYDQVRALVNARPVDTEITDRIPKGYEGLHSLIFEYPKFTIWKDQHSDNLKNKNFFGCSRENAGNLITTSSAAITAIRKWAEGSKDLSLNHVVALVNVIEVIEWLFAFTNATSESKINDIDNDPTTGC